MRSSTGRWISSTLANGPPASRLAPNTDPLARRRWTSARRGSTGYDAVVGELLSAAWAALIKGLQTVAICRLAENPPNGEVAEVQRAQ
jgi:hypothetical protein